MKISELRLTYQDIPKQCVTNKSMQNMLKTQLLDIEIQGFI